MYGLMPGWKETYICAKETYIRAEETNKNVKEINKYVKETWSRHGSAT